MKCDGRLIYNDKKTAMRSLRTLSPMRDNGTTMSVRHCNKCQKYHVIVKSKAQSKR